LGEWKVHAAELAGGQAEDRVPVVKPEAAARAESEPLQSYVGATEELQAASSAQQEPAAEEPEKPEAAEAEAEVKATEAEEAAEATEAEAEEAAEAEDSAADETEKSKYGDAVNAGVDPSQRYQVMEQIVKSEEAPKVKREGGKRMSKKERELRKKGLSTEEIEEYMANAALNQASKPTVKEQLAKQEAAAAAKPVEVLRGKSGKKKKLKDKYADQDEDERALRMELLGHKPAPKPKNKSSTKSSNATQGAAPAEQAAVVE